MLSSLKNVLSSSLLPARGGSPSLKPLPASSEDFIHELKTFQNLDRESEPPPRAKLYFNVLSSAKIKRPFDFAMILLVGVSGVGKSSTINHLLDTGEGDPVAMTSSTKSETRKTSEYVLTFDEPTFEVSDLRMNVVDTPGSKDTAGDKQDACNFLSIERFFETHPSLPEELVYPNLVFLTVSAMDQRISGPNSDLSKCLRGIKLLNVVDVKRPNLVVVLTFCCSVNHKNLKKWEEKMEEKKDTISNVVFRVLGITPPVALIENDYEDLTKDGDYTLLPNGEKQPKNLYDACQKLLEKNEDRFGLMVFNAAFTKSKKNQATNGYEVKAKDSTVEALSDKESEYLNIFTEAARGGIDLIAKGANEYIEENKLGKTEKEEVFSIVKTMKSLGLSDEAKLQCISIGDICCVHPQELSHHGIKMLEQKFGIKSDESVNTAKLVGQGYNIIADKPAAAQIMTFSSVDEKRFGFKIPSCAQVIKANETREYQMDFQSDESYVKSRLESLGLNVDLAQTIIQMAPKLGFSKSWKNSRSDKSMKTTTSSLIECRVAKLNFGNFETKDISFTKDFRSAVEELPHEYTDEDKNKFMKFFDKFGQYVVTSAYVGGAVETKICKQTLERSEDAEETVDGSAAAKLPGIFGGKGHGKTQPSTRSAKNAVLNITETRWHGGRSDLHNKSTLESEEKMLMWKASFSKEPTLLTNEMSLQPISSVVGIIDKTKGESCQEAFRNIFHSNDYRPVRDRQEEIALEEKKKIDNDKNEESRKKSNSRSKSIKAPDTNGWWETITSSKVIVGTVVVIAGACLAILAVFKK